MKGGFSLRNQEIEYYEMNVKKSCDIAFCLIIFNLYIFTNFYKKVLNLKILKNNYFF